MSSRCFRLAFFTLLGLVSTTHGSLAQSSETSDKGLSSSPQPAILNNYGRLPLAFIRNDGQTDKQVQYLAHSNNVSLFLTPTEAVFSLTKPVVSSQPHEKKHLSSRSVVSSVVRMRLQAANPHPVVSAMQPLPGRVNYFPGNDPTKWHSNVPTSAKVRYGSVYPGVDLLYYGNNRQLEYDFVVAPHADPKRIVLSFAGARRVRIERSGELALELGVGALRWHRPVVYQEVNGRRRSIAGRYVALGAHTVGFEVGRYAPDLPLVIDPQLVYSTYLGGSGGIYGDFGNGIAIDAQGNAYIVGTTYSSDFPVTKSAFQTKIKSTHGSVTVTKLSPNGTSEVYSTYLGGTGGTSHADYGQGIAVDAQGNAYVTGYTFSADFPTTTGAFQTTRKTKGYHAFVTKVSASGSSLAYSTYLGGSGGMVGDYGYGIAVDAQNNAYVTGVTTSSDFPVTTGAFQTTLKDTSNGNAFVTKLNASGSAPVYSSYLGGTGIPNSGGATGTSIAVDTLGDAYVTGHTGSTDFPVTTNAFQSALKSNFTNAFVTRFSADGSSLVYSTYLGGSGGNFTGDSGSGIAVDAQDNAYVTGVTTSSDFPVTTGAFQTVLKSSAGNAFLTKLNASGEELLYSTFLGGTGSDSGSGIAVDSLGYAYVTGSTSSADFPTTANALQTTPGNKYANGFVTKLDLSGSSLVYSTYLGGSGGNFTGDHSVGIAVDAHDIAYVTGQTVSADFPVTTGAFQTGLKTSNGNAFVTKLQIPVPTPTYFSVVPYASGSVGAKIVLPAQLVNGGTKLGIPNVNIAFTLAATNLGTTLTDASGKGTLTTTIPDGLNAGTDYLIQVSFPGNNLYAASIGTGRLILLKGNTQFTSKPNAAGKQGALVTFTIKLVRVSDGKPLPQETVTFSVDGSSVGTVTTDTTGTASQSYTIPVNAKVGAHTTQASFTGDTNYASSVVFGTLTITK